jgi:hypothetical protein
MANDQHLPEEEIRQATLKVLQEVGEQARALTLHATAMTDFLSKLDARVAGTETVAHVVDENEDRTQAAHWVSAQKQVVSFLYNESQRYTALVIGGAYAGYFTTLVTLSARFSNKQLLLSSLFMTISLSIFVFWEVWNMVMLSVKAARGKLEKSVGRVYWIAWAIVVFATVGTAIPALWISVSVYLKGLGFIS